MRTGSKSAIERRAATIGIESLLERVIGEYREMPGLSITARQARRLWELDEPTCGRVLAALVDRGFLVVTPGGAYVRRE